MEYLRCKIREEIVGEVIAVVGSSCRGRDEHDSEGCCHQKACHFNGLWGEDAGPG